MTVPPNSGLVAVAWVRGISATGPFDPSRVAATLPSGTGADAALVAGFVQVSVVGGAPDIDIPVRRPVITIDAWVASGTGGRPPLGRAWALAEAVRTATEGTFGWRRAVAMPTGYGSAQVLSAYAVSEPREIKSDPGRYARVQFDLQIDWSPGA